MSKYEALPQFLARVEHATYRMSFGEMEKILGFKLPKSAYEHEAWWSNNATGHSHARAWLKSGWRTEAIDLGWTQGYVPALGPVAWSAATPQKTRSLGLHGRHGHDRCPGTDVTAPSDEKWNAEEGRLAQ